MTAWPWSESGAAFWTRMELDRPLMGDLIRELRPPSPSGPTPVHGDIEALCVEARALLPKVAVSRRVAQLRRNREFTARMTKTAEQMLGINEREMS